jgi:hypothetical protein
VQRAVVGMAKAAKRGTIWNPRVLLQRPKRAARRAVAGDDWYQTRLMETVG